MKIITGNCLICKRNTKRCLYSGKNTIYLCNDCNIAFFEIEEEISSKYDKILNTMKIAHENKINIGLALNVINQKYDLKEAKKRQYVKNREKEGKTVDIFAMGHRLPGSRK